MVLRSMHGQVLAGEPQGAGGGENWWIFYLFVGAFRAFPLIAPLFGCRGTSSRTAWPSGIPRVTFHRSYS